MRISVDIPAPLSTFEKMFSSFGRHLPAGSAFEFQLPGRPLRRTGDGETKFRITFHNEKAVDALKSMDEMRIGKAYLSGNLSIDGDLVAALNLRNSLTDKKQSHGMRSTFSFVQVGARQRAVSGHAAVKLPKSNVCHTLVRP